MPVPFEDLPVLLPDDVDFMPTGESPLNYHEGFLNTTCPKCGGPATRETDTMDTFICSSWYQYAYLSPYYREGESVDRDAMPWDPDEAGLLGAGGYLHRRRGTRRDAPALHALLHQGAARRGRGRFRRADAATRNQGIILGEPRWGDCAEVTGTWEGAAFKAENIKVYSFEDRETWPEATRGDTCVCGEVMDRDDVSLKVRTSDDGDLAVVLVDEDLPVDIPGREVVGSVSDILYHLEVEKMSKSKKNVVAPDDLVAELRRGYRARLPDVRLALGAGRPVGQPGHRGRRPLDQPRVEHRDRGARADGEAQRRRRRTRTPTRDALRHQERHGGYGELRLQHHHRPV